jgi:hypothetical protein
MQPSYAELALRPYHHLYLAIDSSRIRCSIPGRDIPRVVHAPSNSALKGTAEILEALEHLRREGVEFELRLLEGRPNSEVLQELHDADVLVDEVRELNYGMLALEAMASGCAVAAGNQPTVVPLPPERPVWPLTPDNLGPQLRRLLTDRDLRLRLAGAGRPFVETYHAPQVVARGMEQALAGAKPDYRPGFFAYRYQLPEGEALSPRLRKLSSEIVHRYGVAQGVDLQELAERGLIRTPGRGRQPSVPRWEPGPSLVDVPPGHPRSDAPDA